MDRNIIKLHFRLHSEKFEKPRVNSIDNVFLVIKIGNSMKTSKFIITSNDFIIIE